MENPAYTAIAAQTYISPRQAAYLVWTDLGLDSTGASPALFNSPIQVRGAFEQSWQDGLLVQDQDSCSWWLGIAGSGTISWRSLGGQPFMRA